MEKLTFQEEEAMLIVWKLEGGVIKDFLNQYPDPKPPYTTLASIVKNLERKGYVKAKLYGNTYFYAPLIQQDAYKRNSMSNFVNKYFANSYKSMVSFFAKDEKISAEELKEIMSIIEKEKEQ